MSDRGADEHLDVLRRFGLGDEDLHAWQVSRLPDDSFDEWLVDRVARRPSGSRAQAVYGAEDVHDFARSAILLALALGPDDVLLEVGCGGGLLLRYALRTGARATGIDHSEEIGPHGRLAIYTTAPELRGTPAAPEPIAAFSHFYTDEELAELARHTNFNQVKVQNEHGSQLLTANV